MKFELKDMCLNRGIWPESQCLCGFQAYGHIPTYGFAGLVALHLVDMFVTFYYI